MPKIKVAAIQFNAHDTLEETLNGLEKDFSLIKRKGEAPELIVLPELWITGFTKKNIEKYFKNGWEKRTIEKLKSLSNTHRVSILGSIPHRDNTSRKKFNAIPLIVYDNNSGKCDLKGWYHKTQLFRYQEEGLGFSPGREARYNSPIIDISTHNKEKVKLGVSICGELRYPEQFQAYAIEKCDLIVNCSQWRGRLYLQSAPQPHFEHWEPLLKARAIETGRYLIGVNRIGRDNKYWYDGKSMLIDPNGKLKKPNNEFGQGIKKIGKKIQIYEFYTQDRPNEAGVDPETRRGLFKFWVWESIYRLWEILWSNTPVALDKFIPYAHEKPIKVDEKLCFVAIPSVVEGYSKKGNENRQKIIQSEINRVLKRYKLKKCVIMLQQTDADIPKAIFRYILRSGLVIADITDANANVLYETGLVHALRKPIIVITEEEDPQKVPFDIRHFRYVPFSLKQKKTNAIIPSLSQALTPYIKEYADLNSSNSTPLD